MKEKKKEGGTSMIAPHPMSKKKKEELRPVEDLARDAGLPPWEAAGLMRAASWAGGKEVDQKTFDSALAAFRKRPQGGGRITA